MSGGPRDGPQRRVWWQRRFGGHLQYPSALSDAPPSPMAVMMLAAAADALIDGDCAEAIEHALTISSLEDHSDITLGLAVTALKVIGVLDLDDRADHVRIWLLRKATSARRNNRDIRALTDSLRGIVSEGALIPLLKRVREIEAGAVSLQPAYDPKTLVTDIGMVAGVHGDWRHAIHASQTESKVLDQLSAGENFMIREAAQSLAAESIAAREAEYRAVAQELALLRLELEEQKLRAKKDTLNKAAFGLPTELTAALLVLLPVAWVITVLIFWYF